MQYLTSRIFALLSVVLLFLGGLLMHNVDNYWVYSLLLFVGFVILFGIAWYLQRKPELG